MVEPRSPEEGIVRVAGREGLHEDVLAASRQMQRSRLPGCLKPVSAVSVRARHSQSARTQGGCLVAGERSTRLARAPHTHRHDYGYGDKAKTDLLNLPPRMNTVLCPRTMPVRPRDKSPPDPALPLCATSTRANLDRSKGFRSPCEAAVPPWALTAPSNSRFRLLATRSSGARSVAMREKALQTAPHEGRASRPRPAHRTGQRVWSALATWVRAPRLRRRFGRDQHGRRPPGMAYSAARRLRGPRACSAYICHRTHFAAERQQPRELLGDLGAAERPSAALVDHQQKRVPKMPHAFHLDVQAAKGLLKRFEIGPEICPVVQRAQFVPEVDIRGEKRIEQRAHSSRVELIERPTWCAPADPATSPVQYPAGGTVP